MTPKPEDVLVKKDNIFYVCLRISEWVWKCGNCLKGLIKPAFPRGKTCRVCGAKLNG